MTAPIVSETAPGWPITIEFFIFDTNKLTNWAYYQLLFMTFVVIVFVYIGKFL